MSISARTLSLPRAGVHRPITLSFPRKLILAFAIAIAIPLFGYAGFVHVINGQRMRMLDEAALNQRLVVVTQHVRAMGLRVLYAATAARDEWLQTASRGTVETVGPAFLRDLAHSQGITAGAILTADGSQAPVILGKDLVLDAMLTETSHAAAALDGESSWGVVGHRDSLVVVGAAPVKSRDGSGTILGAIVVGHQITASEVESVLGAGVCKAALTTLKPDDPARAKAEAAMSMLRNTSGFQATSVGGVSTGETVSMSMVFAGQAKDDAPAQLSVSMDRSALPGRGPRFVTVAFGAFACALLLGALLTSLVSAWVNQPLEELRERVEDLAAGKRGAPPLRIETDDSLGRLARAFNHMVASREETQELLLHNERLAMAGKLSAAIAHEVKNVLAPIHLRAELLMQCVRDPLARENLEGMQAEIDRGAALLRNLLDLARNSGNEMRAVAVDDLLLRAADLVAPQLSHSSIGLSVNRIGDDTLIWGDQSELLQLLVNLVQNASDAHAKHVTLSADKVDGHVTITVTDDGMGMDEATRQRALEPFFTTKPCGKGTGLGLSICHSIAEAHGGTLGIESQRHAGTRVRLSLPAIGED